jgi:hypothetical protein
MRFLQPTSAPTGILSNVRPWVATGNGFFLVENAFSMPPFHSLLLLEGIMDNVLLDR